MQVKPSFNDFVISTDLKDYSSAEELKQAVKNMLLELLKAEVYTQAQYDKEYMFFFPTEEYKKAIKAKFREYSRG